MADVGVFRRYKGFNDYDAEAKKVGLAQALQVAQLRSSASGASLPAPLQLANEYQKRMAAGDTQGANLIMQFAKSQDKGLQVDANGQYAPLPGYAPAAAEIEGAKSSARADSKNLSDAAYKPAIAGNSAFSSAMGKDRAATEVEGRKITENTATNLAAFEDLKKSAVAAPGGIFNNAAAAGSNLANSPTPSSIAQGDFRTKRAAAENAIRSTFRVVGSGAQSDADAKPFINMLPNENDSEPVKQAKIDAAMSAMKTKASELASIRGLKDPFASTINSLDDVLATEGGDTAPAKLAPKDIQASLFNARKAIKANPSAKAAIIQKLQSAGIDTKGL